MKINKRLKHIANYVDDFSNVIDVGCDHALLSIYLEKNKNCSSIIASDINEGPLNHARENIKFYNSKKVKLKLGSGISTIEDNTDTVIIGGMGTSTIISILNEDKEKLKDIKKIILSPNNDFEILRNAILKFGFIIEREEFVFERGKFYPIIICIKGKKEFSDQDLKFGVNVILNDDYKNYLKYILKKYEDIEKNIPDGNFKKKDFIEYINCIKQKLLYF